MNVSQLLGDKGHEVITVQPHRTLADAVKVLAERRIGAVAVTGADGGLVGILSERDIVRAMSERGAAALDRTVGDTMTRNVVTCTETDTIGHLMERMTAGKFRHLPVVEDGRLVGA